MARIMWAWQESSVPHLALFFSFLLFTIMSKTSFSLCSVSLIRMKKAKPQKEEEVVENQFLLFFLCPCTSYIISPSIKHNPKPKILNPRH